MADIKIRKKYHILSLLAKKMKIFSTLFMTKDRIMFKIIIAKSELLNGVQIKKEFHYQNSMTNFYLNAIHF